LDDLSGRADPTAMVEYVYNLFLININNKELDFEEQLYNEIFECNLLTSFLEDRNITQEGYIGLLDYLPLLQAQDVPSSIESVKLLNLNSITATVEVNLAYNKPHIIIVALIKKGGHWKIYDTKFRDDVNDDGLRKTLKVPL